MRRFIACFLLCLSLTVHAESKEEPKDPPVMLDVTSFEDDDVKAVLDKLNKLKKDGVTDIWLRINTNGGSVSGGMALIQGIEDLRQPITCVVDTRAYSMGAVLLEEVCSKRLMTDRSQLMFHTAGAMLQGSASALSSQLDQVHNINESIIRMLARHLSISEDEIRKRIDGDGKMWFLSAAEALKVGAIDGVVDPLKLPEIVKVDPPQVDIKKLLGL